MTEATHLDRAAALLLSVGRAALGDIDTGAALHCLQARALLCDAGAQPVPLAPPRTVDTPPSPGTPSGTRSPNSPTWHQRPSPRALSSPPRTPASRPCMNSAEPRPHHGHLRPRSPRGAPPAHRTEPSALDAGQGR